LEQVEARPEPTRFAYAVQEAEVARAQRLVAESLRWLERSEADLAGRRRGDPGKVELARELCSLTPMPLAWTAERLRMGSPGVSGVATPAAG